MAIELVDSKSYNRKAKKWYNILLIGLFAITGYSIYVGHNTNSIDLRDSLCPLTEIYRPSSYEQNKPVLHKILFDQTFRNNSALKLIGAIQQKTDVTDDLPLLVEDNPEIWEKFNQFSNYLNKTFPIFHNHTELEKVNYHGLIYTWKGTNNTLQPLVLMAHQDTVPVSGETLPQWDHDPFAGIYDGIHLYGRGTSDCKNLLIGLLETAELLIENGFIPKRTIIFSFGFDEEVGGIRNKNALFLEQKYGKDSMYAIHDEGGVSLTKSEDVIIAVPGTSEKGYMDFEIILKMPGGHSSVPPKHTAIGITGDLIVTIENDEFPTYFTDKNPTFYQYMCMAENSIDIDQKLKKSIMNSPFNSKANKELRDYINSDVKTSYSIKTTQALDIIHGGSKINALPEYIQLMINTRIAMEETHVTTLEKMVRDVEFISKKYDMGLDIEYQNGTIVNLIPYDSASGAFTVKVGQYIDPAPLTPTNDEHWKIFAGSLRHMYEELALPDMFKDKRVIVSPGIGSGNTDTKYYWNLSKHIYRYRPGEMTTIESHAHGINEFIKFDSHLQIIAFYYEYIHSIDEL
ncbi:hypothetical protein C6P40_003046 [Pichia californica]|uniref:Peptidase M20 dimerisation domain-containing protein n=1 Tax=Pichia californica TaxID=460514 RepID=A0A9P6WIZ9_9ASCO|nr:hypothetical protein C6P40_003046 [[Candida] californica]